VPHLVALLRAPDPRVADAALACLPRNASRRVREVRLDPGQADYTPAQRAQIEANRAVLEENRRLQELVVPPGAPPARREETLRAWEAWLAGARGRFERGFFGTIGTILFDTRYAHYLGSLLSGDLGVSSENRRPVWELIRDRLPRTFTLAFLALLLEYLIAVPLGIFSAVRQNSAADRTIAVFLFMLYSLPSFYVGTMLLKYLTVGEPLQIFPTGGFGGSDTDLTVLGRLSDVARHLVLPVACLAYASFAGLSRFARVGIVDGSIIPARVETAAGKGML